MFLFKLMIIMIVKTLKKIISEKQCKKLRELKYKLYCLSKGWTFEFKNGKYIITTNKKKIYLKNENLSIITYIKTINEIFKNQTKIDLTKNYYSANIYNQTVKIDFLTILEWESAICKYNTNYNLKKGDVILDVGAYHGAYSFYALPKIGTTGKIFAFEPDPDNFKILESNIKQNNISNIIPINCALFNKTGKQKFVISNAGSSLYLNEHNLNGDSLKNKKIISVPTISFKDFIKKYKIKSIDFIKMDCEGSEVEIYDDYLKNCYPKIKTHFAIASYHYRDDYKSKTNIILKNKFANQNIKTTEKNKQHLTTHIDTTL